MAQQPQQPQNDTWEQTLRKMTELGELSATMKDSTAKLSAKRNAMIQIVVSMREKMKTIQSVIDKAKNEGNTAITTCRQAIKDAGPEQKAKLDELKNQITQLSNFDELEKNIKALDGDINRITGVAGAAKTALSGNQQGGYTYGKSRKKGKGRRKRTKKSRKKGSKKH